MWASELESLVVMGFDREEALNALNMANGDTDLATEFLLNSDSIPQGEDEVELHQPPSEPESVPLSNISIEESIEEESFSNPVE